MNSTIPTVDLNDYINGTSEKKAAFVQALGKAYEEIGFVAVKNHGLSDELQNKLYSSVKSFFDLEDEVKNKYDGSSNAGQRGYTAKGKEHAKGRNVGDLKEFYHVGQPLTNGRDEITKDYPDNIFPTEVPNFKEATLQTFILLEEAGRQLLRAIATYLDLPVNYFDDKILNGNSILRPIHYFPIDDPDSIPEDAVRSAAHEDINLITLLMGASAEGLEVLNKNNEWIAVTSVPECVVVNVGDMLQRLTNNKLCSTTHRVVNPPKEKMNTSRYSIPFFLHPKSNMSLACLENCITSERPKAYPDATAGEYLNERLREIGLLK